MPTKCVSRRTHSYPCVALQFHGGELQAAFPRSLLELPQHVTAFHRKTLVSHDVSV